MLLILKVKYLFFKNMIMRLDVKKEACMVYLPRKYDVFLGLCKVDSIQAILGENFSQSENVDVGANFKFALPPLARGIPSYVPLCQSFEQL